MRLSFSINGTVFKYPGAGGWHFVSVPKKESEKVKKSKATRVGFGFVKVKAKLGKTVWDTSLFPTKEGHYLLSIKGTVRTKEGILEGDVVKIQCSLL